jgi:hypothetical protein
MKKPTLFEKWLLTEAERAQALKELNEAFDPKDEMRIRDIITKARGKKDTELSLARTMAHMIKDEAKAVRRAEAAEHLGQNEMANIFYARANELAGGSPSEPAIEEPTSAYSEEPTEEPAPKPRIVVQPRPKPNQRKPGDYFKISAKMILDGDKVGLSDGKAWRAGAKKKEQVATWATLTGLREVEVEAAWRSLFENGFIAKDGTVDPFAARYVASIAMGRLPRSARERRPEKKKETPDE